MPSECALIIGDLYTGHKQLSTHGIHDCQPPVNWTQV
jgi:hypothetical protein